MNRGLGYIPDAHDPRDQPVARLGLSRPIPASFSMRHLVVEVLDQAETSSCVAHSWAQALRIADRVAGVKAPQLSSRQYLYYNARAFDGEAIVDQGTQLRSCARGLVKFGRPPERAWPFDTRHINDRPPWLAYRDGYDHKGPAGYYRVTTIEEIKQALASSKPVVGGRDVSNSIFDYRSGVYDPEQEESIGGHAMTFTGYGPDHFEICGSWGPAYGEGGFMRVSAKWARGFNDLWAVHL